MPLFGGLRSSSSSSKEGWGKDVRAQKRRTSAAITAKRRKGGVGNDSHLPAIPFPFLIPPEMQWLLRRWDLEAIIGRSVFLCKRFLSLPREIQSLFSWSFLLFTIFFISGLWTLKLALFAFLMFLRPFEDPEKRGERSTTTGTKKGTTTKGKRGRKARVFSEDPLISALQRIPETFAFSSVAPSRAGSTACTPSRKVSFPPVVSTAQIAQDSTGIQQSPLSMTPAQSTRFQPCLDWEEPVFYNSRSSTDRECSIGRRDELDLGPSPEWRLQPREGMPRNAHRAVTLPYHSPLFLPTSASHISMSGPYPDSLAPLSLPVEITQEPEEESEWERQQRVSLMLSGGVRHKSASFHRLEQAQKFFNRKFSRSGGEAEVANGEGNRMREASLTEIASGQ